MKKVVLVGLVLAGIGASVACGTNYVVRSPDGIHLIAKSEFSFSPTYVDVRSWGAVDFVRAPRLKQALLDREIPDFDNLRLKVAAVEGAAQVGGRIDAMADAAGRKVAETGRELDRKYDLRGKAEAVKGAASRAASGAAEKLKGFFNR